MRELVIDIVLTIIVLISVWLTSGYPVIKIDTIVTTIMPIVVGLIIVGFSLKPEPVWQWHDDDKNMITILMPQLLSVLIMSLYIFIPFLILFAGFVILLLQFLGLFKRIILSERLFVSKVMATGTIFVTSFLFGVAVAAFIKAISLILFFGILLVVWFFLVLLLPFKLAKMLGINLIMSTIGVFAISTGIFLNSDQLVAAGITLLAVDLQRLTQRQT